MAKLLNPVRIFKPLDREQRSHLESELRSFERSRQWQDEKSIIAKGPYAVKRAARLYDRVVTRYIRKVRAVYERQGRLIEKQSEKVREEMLFGSPVKALAMLKKFQVKK